jgi:hypothetical protein
VTITTAGTATSTIATTTNGRITTIVVVVITTTNAKRNGRTGPLPIAATRHSSHAWCTGQRASTPPRSATKTPRTTNVKFKTKKPQYKVHHNDVRYTSDDDKSHSSTDTLVPSEDLASASSKSKKTMRMIIIILILIKK